MYHHALLYLIGESEIKQYFPLENNLKTDRSVEAAWEGHSQLPVVILCCSFSKIHISDFCIFYYYHLILTIMLKCIVTY